MQKRVTELENNERRLYDGNKGLMEEIQFLKFRAKTLDDLHESVVQKNWPHDGSFKDKKCPMPFTRIEILPRGEVYTCCSGFIKHNYFIGNIFTDKNFDDIWNSEKALKLRYSVSNGNFEYCQKLCRFFHNDAEQDKDFPQLPRTKADFADSYKSCYMTTFPKEIVLTCDESCNLFCSSCRSKRKVLDRDAADSLYEKLMTIVRPMLKDCRSLRALSSGDLFASSACSRFYKTLSIEEFPNLSLYIITNLQLLTAKKWEEFKNLHDFPIDLRASVDGACKETYEKIRRGAKWETLCENLTWIKEWRKSPKNNIKEFMLHYVVQRDNFDELEDFCRFAESMEVDKVWFQQIGNWGTYSDEEFKEINVFHKENPNREKNIQKLKDVMKKGWKVKVLQNII